MMFKSSVLTLADNTPHLFRDGISICCENNTGHINTLCGQNVDLLYYVKAGGTYCGLFAQSKKCGAREIAFASERL
jgi:hypothetical protein